MDGPHRLATPEPTIVDWAKHIAPASSILDVAAGRGRHAIWLAKLGHSVTAVDQDTKALRDQSHPNILTVTADLENSAWPFEGQQFDAVVVVNYLFRPLIPTLIASVKDGGYLLYETFAAGNENYGRPRNPNFLLQPGELQRAIKGQLEVLDASDGPVGNPPTSVRQRILAQRRSK
jgi:SAM-dependent methyltransferase